MYSFKMYISQHILIAIDCFYAWKIRLQMIWMILWMVKWLSFNIIEIAMFGSKNKLHQQAMTKYHHITTISFFIYNKNILYETQNSSKWNLEFKWRSIWISGA